MAQPTVIIDSQPEMQKPMLAHLREGSSEPVDLIEKQVGYYSNRSKAAHVCADSDSQILDWRQDQC